MLHIRQKGAEDVVSHLDRVSKALDSDLHQTTQQALFYVHSQVPPYPDAPATSRYRRTGTLGRSITTMGSASGPALSRVEGSGSHVIGYIGSAVSYAPYVIDEGRQAFMHRGRWWTLQQVVSKSREGIIRIYRAFVDKTIG